MTLKEAQELKRSTEDTILALLTRLEERTGVSISDIDITSQRTMGFSNFKVTAVNLKIEL